MSTPIEAGLRLDKWLWHARFFKTRSRATAAVRGGHVKLNGERASPGVRVRIGDRLQIVRERLRYDVRVVALPPRRGPAAAARTCYEEDESSARARQERLEGLKSDRLRMPLTRGRPDKRTRRMLRSRQRDGN